jgi:anti-sigma regulatory factor (Ser/Thr protein kinase)
MKSDQTESANGRTAFSSDGFNPRAAPEECRRQAIVIERLSEALSTFERGARALKAENSELRAENGRLRNHRRLEAGPDRRVDGGEPAEVAIPLGVQAPGIARSVVAERLADQVAPRVLEAALLLVSELVTNSVRHSGVPEGEDVVVRVDIWRDGCRLEVEDPGRDGVIAPQPQDLLKGGGMGLHLVQMLSERWGVVRAAEGPTRVWAQLPRAAALA